jgi:signal transduction histidine kinase
MCYLLSSIFMLKRCFCWAVAIALQLSGCLLEASAQEPPPASATMAQDPPDPSANLTNSLGSWIWADKRFNGQTTLFWQAFDIPSSMPVRKARLRMTVDDFYVLFLDGREIGRGAEWRELYDYNLTPLMSPGRHVLAIEAMNSFSYAGMLLGVRVDLADGTFVEVKSDETWRIVPPGTRKWKTTTKAAPAWPKATIVARFGADPWWSTPVRINEMPTLQPIKLLFWQTAWFQVTLLTVCAIVILFSFWLMAQLALHKKERVLLQRERARIAMDIHDDLGSRMTQLVLHGEVAQSELPAESGTRPHLDRICQDARDVLSTLDEILWAVNPRRDTLSDFSAYICGYAQEFLKPTPIQCLFDVESETSDLILDLPIRRALLMVIKETLNNAVKHSGASEVLLQIKCRGRRLTVMIQDNGKGFDSSALTHERNGLTNITQRMAELGGVCLINSRPGEGCRVEFGLALKPSRRQRFGWPWKSSQIPGLPGETKREQHSNEILEANDPARR